MKNETTQDRILEAAKEIMLERSFHSVGLKQILDSAKVPKGSFYHYFKSKEQFGVEMLRHYMEEASNDKRQLLLSKTKESDPLERLFLYLDGGVEYIHSVVGTFPCLALKLASEVSDLSEPMRRELARGFEEWISIYEELFEEGIKKKKLPENFDSLAEAQLIQDLWTGAVHRAVINRSSEPVRSAAKHIRYRISNVMIL